MEKRKHSEAFEEQETSEKRAKTDLNIPAVPVAQQDSQPAQKVKKPRSAYKKDYGGMRSDKITTDKRVVGPSKPKSNRKKKRERAAKAREEQRISALSAEQLAAEQKAKAEEALRQEKKSAFDKKWAKRGKKEIRIRKKRKFDRFGNVPVDIFEIVCHYMHPVTLLQLARTCKGVRSMIMTKKALRWWESCRATIDMPACPRPIGLSEPAYISFMFEDICMAPGCHHKVHVKDFNFCRRYCKPCLPKFLITREQAKVVTQNAIPQHVLYKCHYVPHKLTRVKRPGTCWVVLLDYIWRVRGDWVKLHRSDILGQRRLAQRMDIERGEIKVFGQKLRKWEQAYNSRHHEIIIDRRKEIKSRLLERNKNQGWNTAKCFPELRPEWKRIVDREEKLTLLEWGTIVDRLEEMIRMHILDEAITEALKSTPRLRLAPWFLNKKAEPKSSLPARESVQRSLNEEVDEPKAVEELEEDAEGDDEAAEDVEPRASSLSVASVFPSLRMAEGSNSFSRTATITGYTLASGGSSAPVGNWGTPRSNVAPPVFGQSGFSNYHMNSFSGFNPGLSFGTAGASSAPVWGQPSGSSNGGNVRHPFQAYGIHQ